MINIKVILEKIILFQHFNGEKLTAQDEFLPGFFARNSSYPSNPGNRDLIDRNLNTRRFQHITIESLSSVEERLTVKTGFLANFFAEKVQYLSHYFNVKLKFTL